MTFVSDVLVLTKLDILDPIRHMYALDQNLLIIEFFILLLYAKIIMIQSKIHRISKFKLYIYIYFFNFRNE